MSFIIEQFSVFNVWHAKTLGQESEFSNVHIANMHINLYLKCTIAHAMKEGCYCDNQKLAIDSFSYWLYN